MRTNAKIRRINWDGGRRNGFLLVLMFVIGTQVYHIYSRHEPFRSSYNTDPIDWITDFVQIQILDTRQIQFFHRCA